MWYKTRSDVGHLIYALHPLYNLFNSTSSSCFLFFSSLYAHYPMDMSSLNMPRLCWWLLGLFLSISSRISPLNKSRMDFGGYSLNKLATMSEFLILILMTILPRHRVTPLSFNPFMSIMSWVLGTLPPEFFCIYLWFLFITPNTWHSFESLGEDF